MPRMKKNVRREQIVTAVLDIVAKEGAAGLTIGRIARAVGITEGNLYRHFKNKSEVLHEAASRVFEDLTRTLEIAIAVPGSPLDRLRETFLSHLRYIEQKEGNPRAIFAAAMHGTNQEMRGEALAAMDDYNRRIAHMVREGQREGSIRIEIDPNGLARVFGGMLQESILRWEFSGFAFSLEQDGSGLWETLRTCIAQDK
jgi:TetR/AcrR family transcriptional regulator, fatty acid metabolism regulator protein